MKNIKKSDAWNVYLNGKLIDTVFCNVDSYTADEMKKSLIEHDNYNPEITVRKQK